MDPLDIARWQFGITTVYHFLMVPLTIGLGLSVAVMQTLWHRTGAEHYLRMTKFWGKIFLINFIMGVATGLVQEFQFGLAWSEYSRFVGDVFGAPLAMEALLAFFVESTFLGLWIFGWKRLPPRIHLATIWLASLATIGSAYFIIVANSWMQHPVGVQMIDGRPHMTDVVAVLTNNTAIVAFTHAVTGAFAVGGAMLFGVGWYHLWRRRKDGVDTVDAKGYVIPGAGKGIGRDVVEHKVWFRSLVIGGWIAVVAFAGTAITGDAQGKLMFQQQPMKMAAAEAACHSGTQFSVLSIGQLGSRDCSKMVAVFEVPGVLSFLANGDFTTPVKGVNELVPEYQQKYGTNLPDDPKYGERAGQAIQYVPVMEVTYWGFRLMITFGGLSALACFIGLIITRKGTVPLSKPLMISAVLGILAPFGANSAGWIFTEMGRQPFVVAPNPDPSGIDQVFMYTAAAVSPGVSFGEVLFSLIVLTSVYAVLAVVEVGLLVRFIRGGVASAMPELAHAGSPASDDDEGPSPDRGPDDGKDSDVLAFAY
ncbi:cytochrome ubiquinol oxidase subunit I [Tersicoccus sp. Bi-70]|uniref:cytochrome ubiquinol oxidase subunit I n=1 Tax=Tersicoccus sp. Bi-70 TaxID=1897634 RepID=UPI00097828CD|nr:cytochrome ubiquinol oxidase subunit I [Tersicoccus sp. Bi-70]OMH33170.1 cytochrome BD ubiquinol oxidase subunit I [Tersicoccus sp. Bi-70]